VPRLTDIALKNLPLPERGHVTYWDRPLGVRVSSTGVKTFIVILKSGSRHRIGRYGDITLSQAREAAQRLKAEKTLGRILPASVSLSEARKEYLAQLDVRDNTRAYYERNLDRLKASKLSDVSPRDINNVLDGLSKSSRDQCLASFRAFFRWCIRRHYLDKSPCELMTLGKPTSRSRTLSPEEIKKIWKAADQVGYPFGTLTKLALLLGQRRIELACLRRSWINEEDRIIEFPKEIMKGKKPHSIVYGDLAAVIMKTAPNTGDLFFPGRGKKTPFSGFSKFKARLDELSGVPDFTLHDCRRVVASGMAASGVSLPVIERYLSHTSNTLGGIVQVYQRHSWLPEMKSAAERYEGYLTAILGEN
jgi:integrase